MSARDASGRLLGVVLAGGKSRRFGRDKATAIVDGTAMLDLVIQALAPQVDKVVISGHDWEGYTRIEDRPEGDRGPLGGLNGALAYARANDFDAVLSVPVDVLPVPVHLVALLGGNGPAVLEHQHLLGFWPSSCAEVLDAYLATASDVAFHRWLDHVKVRKIGERIKLFNVNTPADLEDYRHS